MKLKRHNVDRRGNDIKITATWTDVMRRPANVTFAYEKGPDVSNDVVAEGEVREVTGALFGLAEIAWEMGWRPRGLMAAVTQRVEAYKIPPEGQ